MNNAHQAAEASTMMTTEYARTREQSRPSLIARAGMTACFLVTSALLISGLVGSQQRAVATSSINAAALK
jgi:hypothetical protein